MSGVETEQRETTSIKVKPKLWKEVKIEAIKHDKQVSEVLEEAIEDWIKKHGKGRETK
jgi:hypothetical protein